LDETNLGVTFPKEFFINSLVVAGLYVAMISYISLSLMKLYGIARPLEARARIMCVKFLVVR